MQQMAELLEQELVMVALKHVVYGGQIVQQDMFEMKEMVVNLLYQVHQQLRMIIQIDTI
jgi:methylmalonyl-CoA mutase cobalamin-binding subunit